MTVVQHLASGRQTFYNPMLGAVLITLTLKLLQMGISSLVKLSKRGYGLTYFPSFLVLTVISDLRPTTESITFGNWIWIAPLLLLVYAFVMVAVKRFEPYEPELRSYGPFSQLIWTNLLLFLSFFLFTGLFSNTDRYFHQRAKVEALIDKKDYAGALNVVCTMPHTDSVTSMLTVYAVARRGHLADSLFHYPLVGESRTLRPGRVHSWLQPDSVLLKATRNSANYQLTGFLLDRNLHDFARYLPQYYPNDSLRPHYYKEAYKIYSLKLKGLKLKAPYRAGSYAAYYYAP
ncbi:hypothetical protein JCM17724A_20580 [Prevotella fusca JCM 17724]